MFDIIVEVIGNLLTEFGRLFLCLVISLFIAMAICWLLPDRTFHSVIFAVVVLVGFVFGVAWEVLATRDTRGKNDRG
jgi:hypothetical protein